MQRILFIEDDPEIGQLISSWLGRHDIEVLLETRGDLALARVEAEQPDLVLLDIMLPGQDGLSLCRDLRPRFAGPIVMLTSLDSDMNQILSLELGANDYILKTTPPPVLLTDVPPELTLLLWLLADCTHCMGIAWFMRRLPFSPLRTWIFWGAMTGVSGWVPMRMAPSSRPSSTCRSSTVRSRLGNFDSLAGWAAWAASGITTAKAQSSAPARGIHANSKRIQAPQSAGGIPPVAWIDRLSSHRAWPSYIR